MKQELNKLPKHVAMIMDGNGRWAKKRGLPRNLGHRKGANTLQELVLYANEIGIKYMSVFAFSTENWSRPESEVNYLMKLPVEFLNEHHNEYSKKDIKIRVIGGRERLPQDLIDTINRIEDSTKNNNGLQLIIALNYGSRDEIIRATKKIVEDYNNKIINNIDEDIFNSYLFTKDIPDVDLLIRTSGELRISNFLLWQISYSELYFTNVLWPDFRKKEFNKALEHYSKSDRRFGGIKGE